MMVRVLSIVFVLLNYFSITADIPSDRYHIPIVYATDDQYVMPTIVSMESAVRSMSDTSFYEFTILVPNEFKQENINRFGKFEDYYKNKCNVNVIKMGNAYSEYYTGIWGKTMYYRLSIPDILNDKDKAIYLDGDTFVCSDLKEMYDIELDNNYIGGVIDSSYSRSKTTLKQYNDNIENYICSGVLLINCEAWRKDKKIKKEIKKHCEKVQEEELIFPDQDILNIVCGGKIQKIPLKYMFINQPVKDHYTENDFLEAKNNPVIIHYMGDQKPWFFDNGDHEKNLFDKWRRLFYKIKGKYKFKNLKFKNKSYCKCCC